MLYRRAGEWSDAMKVYSRSSNVCAALDRGDGLLALNDSIFVNYVLKIYATGKKYIGEYAVTSKTVALARAVENSVNFNPIKNLGLIILIAAATNIAVSLLLAKEFDPLSWFIRAIFIIIGAAWASCGTGFGEFKKTSFVYKKLKGL